MVGLSSQCPPVAPCEEGYDVFPGRAFAIVLGLAALRYMPHFQTPKTDLEPPESLAEASGLKLMKRLHRDNGWATLQFGHTCSIRAIVVCTLAFPCFGDFVVCPFARFEMDWAFANVIELFGSIRKESTKMMMNCRRSAYVGGAGPGGLMLLNVDVQLSLQDICHDGM